MLASMASVNIMITLPKSQVAEIERCVAKRENTSVSDFVQDAVRKALENDSAFSAMIDQALLQTGGPLTAKEKAWARRALSSGSKAAKRGTAKRKAA